MFALPPPEHGSTVTSASGVKVWLGSLRYAGRNGLGGRCAAAASIARGKTLGHGH